MNRYHDNDGGWWAIIIPLIIVVLLAWWLTSIDNANEADCIGRGGLYVSNTRGSDICYSESGGILHVY